MRALLKLVPTPESERVFPAHQVDLKAVRAHLRQLAAVGWVGRLHGRGARGRSRRAGAASASQ